MPGDVVKSLCHLSIMMVGANIMMAAFLPLPSSNAFVLEQRNQNVNHRRVSLLLKSRTQQSTRLFYEAESNNGGSKKGDDEEEEARRMATVRALQMSFYKPAAAGKSGDVETKNSSSIQKDSLGSTSLDLSTGELRNLPLWRAPWQEVPGRSNVLNVHDPIYTSMFESILYQSQNALPTSDIPRYFGHLYLEGGSRNLSPKVTDEKYQLKTWSRGVRSLDTSDDVKQTIDYQKQPGKDPHESSAVLGCLMQIQDYRRMSDGRLLLLVHALERFVVSKVVQDLPHSIANVQLLPDIEELRLNSTTSHSTALEDVVELPESIVGPARANAIREATQHFHSYEYDSSHELQLPNGPKVGVRHVSYDSMAKVLPYCPYSTTFEAYSQNAATLDSSEKLETPGDEGSCLESKLWSHGIFQIPPSDPEYVDQLYRVETSDCTAPTDLSTDELEQKVWLALNQYWITTQKPISLILLSLLPSKPIAAWPEDFVLHKIVETIGRQQEVGRSEQDTKENTIDITDIDSSIRLGSIKDFNPLHPDYPAYRRQRRLSFSAAYLLETGDEPEKAQRLRALLLSIPSTQQRLKAVLERFYQWQAQKQENLGVFE
jgi:hypothetical protein